MLGETWSILPAYTTEGYLPCTAIRRGYFDGEAFYQWIVNELLPCCNPFPHPRSVLILDNVNSHLNQRVREAVEQKGMLIRFLPPYSPDYSPIELTFGLLKRWMECHWKEPKYVFMNDFGDFMEHAIKASGCDKRVMAHFRQSGAGFTFANNYVRFQRELKRMDI